MRWNNLSTNIEERARLPGYRDEAVVRHFDAPEAMSTNFYEVRAKSILNRVPEASQMPFRWTINPYRGCTHACAYCLGSDTAILMADGTTKPIAELQPGQLIYGTVAEGAYRRLRLTCVLDKWSSIKPAYSVELDDGTELIASEDHRFLTRRGWKHVLGTECGRGRRPHLTVGSKLLGTGGFVAGPPEDDGYKTGYLCGMIRGDAWLGSVAYTRADGSLGAARRFRLALADHEALGRAQRYLADLGVATKESLFHPASGTHRAMYAIAAYGPAKLDVVEPMIRWPLLPSVSWMKGFLAGTFDAEGSCSRGIWRVSNTDAEFVDWICACLDRFGFDYVVEETRRQHRLAIIRLRGGLPEQIRFFLGTDPAISRKRALDGKALKTNARLHVKSIRSLGVVMRMYDITTGTGDFIANGVVSHNCFARPTHKYLDFDAGRDFEREIVVKVNAPERLRVELAKPSWQGEHIALGTNTDPYQWVEGRYMLMRGIWEAMIEARNPGSVLTKSPLLLRDLDLMKELAARAGFSAALSVPTLDERAWRATEPHTPHPRARLEAAAELVRAGIPTGILIAPLMPGINDAPEQLAPLLQMAAEAGASYVTGIALHLRSDVRRLFFQWLSENRDDLVSRYRDLYRYGAYAPAQERRRLAGLVQGPDLSPWQRGRSGYVAAPASRAERVEHRQEALFDPG
ncbi:MAG: LAGLIDADG family homing endonuclease [Solirubrobacteraceae bacterium]